MKKKVGVSPLLVSSSSSKNKNSAKSHFYSDICTFEIYTYSRISEIHEGM